MVKGVLVKSIELFAQIDFQGTLANRGCGSRAISDGQVCVV
ncbi:hypothetical protein Nhal_3200 [Nitrosococcus halophilus Nc 4]|uniref:Uncharacterized protein n=1 Tax=Nitrosococcus halophilus (strain Nc4) TaxID=472759 RepID=D5C004_NITHN|nr:hypothetical protein Nhal_3200 [Nitrosococcus halophilus Nc 4]